MHAPFFRAYVRGAKPPRLASLRWVGRCCRVRPSPVSPAFTPNMAEARPKTSECAEMAWQRAHAHASARTELRSCRSENVAGYVLLAISSRMNEAVHPASTVGNIFYHPGGLHHIRLERRG